MNPEYLSECYIIAYNKALELTKNPNIAIGAAMAVTNVIANQSKMQNQSVGNPLTDLLMAAMMNNKKKDGDNDE